MGAPAAARPHPAARLIAGTIGATWALWLAGGLYLAGPLLGWALGGMAAWRYYAAPALPPAERPRALPWVLWAWLAGMAAMLAILVIGHWNFDLGAGQTLKSAAGWAKGWVLLALFPLAGYALPIRLEEVARAICRLARQSLFLLPLFVAAPLVHWPQLLWVSPLAHVGGADDGFFSAYLYTREPGVGTPRWQFFAPWSPAAGMVAVVHVILARAEPDARWRWTAYAAGLAMALLSTSRMAVVALLVIGPVTALIGRLDRPGTWFGLAPVLAFAALFVAQGQAVFDSLAQDFTGARAASSRVRATLGRLAVERWQDEAYWFGHGVVERGPHLVEYMPIGSHHTWYGLLFVKGLTGALALAVPMLASLAAGIALALRGRAGQVALALVLAFWLYSFGENLEVLIYLTWPGMLALGIVLRQYGPEGRRMPRWSFADLDRAARAAG